MEAAQTSLLVEAARSGNDAAFTQLIKQHDGAVRGLVYSMTKDATLTDDILQEAYFKAYRSLASFKGESAFGTWLHQVAYRTTIDEIRRLKRVPQPIELSAAEPVNTSVENQVASKIDLATALQVLPEQQRAIVVLVDGQGFSYADVAQILDIPIGTVGSQAHTARRTVRRLLRLDTEEER